MNFQHNDKQWFPDTGTTHYMTADLQSLGNRSESHGNDKIYVGNGQTLRLSLTRVQSLHILLLSLFSSFESRLKVPIRVGISPVVGVSEELLVGIGSGELALISSI